MLSVQNRTRLKTSHYCTHTAVTGLPSDSKISHIAGVESLTDLECLASDSSLLRPLAASQIHQIQFADGGPLLSFSQHTHLDMNGEDSV